MNQNLLTRVRTLRAQNPYHPLGITTAVSIARYETNPPAGPYPFLLELATADVNQGVRGEVAGLTVWVRVVDDEVNELGDDDVTGTFTDTFTDGCVKNIRRNWTTDYEWYQPSTIRAAETRADYSRYGMSKAVADEALAWSVRQDMRDDASRVYSAVRVSILLDGEELATGSLWGIDAIDGYDPIPHLIETAVDLIDQTLDDVRNNAGDLIARAREASYGALRHADTVARVLNTLTKGDNGNGTGQG